MPPGDAAVSPYPSPLLRTGVFPGPRQSAYHVETAENIVRIAKDFTAEPSPHDEEGQDYGQQLDAEGQRLFLQLGDRLNEAQQDADERGHDDGRHRQHEHQIERFYGVIDGG